MGGDSRSRLSSQGRAIAGETGGRLTAAVRIADVEAAARTRRGAVPAQCGGSNSGGGGGEDSRRRCRCNREGHAEHDHTKKRANFIHECDLVSLRFSTVALRRGAVDRES